jgi:hypothetical protein
MWGRWLGGRQQFGYFKMLLATNRAFFFVPFDLYLLRFPTGSYISRHVDPVDEGRCHFRLNIVIWKASQGGDFLLFPSSAEVQHLVSQMVHAPKKRVPKISLSPLHRARRGSCNMAACFTSDRT